METLVCQQPCSAPVLTRKQSQHFKSVRLAAAREDLVCQQPWLLHTAMMATNSTESALPGPCIAHCLYKRVFCPDLCVPVAAVHLFGVFQFIALIFSWVFVRETRGVPIEEVRCPALVPQQPWELCCPL